MSVSIPYLRWSSIRIDNPHLHPNKAVVNCLVSNIIESKYEFMAITHHKGIQQFQTVELRGLQ